MSEILVWFELQMNVEEITGQRKLQKGIYWNHDFLNSAQNSSPVSPFLQVSDQQNILWISLQELREWNVFLE